MEADKPLIPRAPYACRNLAGNEWRVPAGADESGGVVEVASPYTNTIVSRVPRSGPREVDRIVAAARDAAPAWAATPMKERAQILLKYRAILERDVDLLAHACAVEAGKTVAEGRAEVLKGIEVLEFACSLQNGVDGHGGVLEVSRGVTCEYRREPLGVVAGIVPFNFPVMVPMWMFPIAIAVGNAFVLKPSEKVPTGACLLAERFLEAGLPPGIFSIVHGARETVDALISHPDVQAIAFVGSSAVAKHVYVTGTSLGKRVLALGGAKNHLIVVPDADRAVTIPGVVDSFTGCAGQRCMAASVLLAVGDAQSIVDDVVARARSIKLGVGMGAMIDSGAIDRISAAISRAESEGAKVLLDGRKPKLAEGAPAEYATGNWLGPTILDHVKPGSEAAMRELFGPLLSIVRVASLAEALAIENANPYGNACSVFTTSGAVAQHVAERARAGMIGINVGVPVPREPFSFGGINDSRFGVGDITGPSAVEFWTQTKKITRKWSLQRDGNWMS
ncbi:MAG: CoA-acylating methylmalonate-semialdehyde dehydrogenase [Polyangiales bacterium]